MDTSFIKNNLKKVGNIVFSRYGIYAILFLVFVFSFWVYSFSQMSKVQNLLIKMGERLVGREIDHDVWIYIIREKGHVFLFKFFSIKALAGYFLYAFLYCYWNNYIKKDFLKRIFPTVRILVFISYVLITFITLVHHEPWFDEYHAWDIARYYNIPQILYEMRYEGHFILWYLILYPFAHYGAPIIILNLISWIIMCISVAFFLKKAPFHFVCKLLVIASSVFLFTYPVISRPYVMIVPILFLLASIYRDNDKFIFRGVLLFLLANTHAYIEGLCGMLILEQTVNLICRKKNDVTDVKVSEVVGISLGCFGMLFAFLQVLPAFWSSSAMKTSVTIQWTKLYSFLSGSGFHSLFQQVIFILLLVSYFAFILYVEKKVFAITFLSILYMMLFCIVLYSAEVSNRAVMWFLIFLYSAWILCVTVKSKEKIIITQVFMCCFSLLLYNPKMNEFDVHHLYSQYAVTHIAKTVKQYVPEGSSLYVLGVDSGIQGALTKYNVYSVLTGEPVKPGQFNRKKVVEEKDYADCIVNILESKEKNGFYMVGFNETIYDIDNKHHPFTKNLVTLVPNAIVYNGELNHWSLYYIAP